MYNVKFLLDTAGTGVDETVIRFEAVSRSGFSVSVRVNDDMADVIFPPNEKWGILMHSELVGETVKRTVLAG